MKSQYIESSSFTIKTFLQATIPSYVFPAIMSWGSGWLMKNEVLKQSSFISIALPSLIATIITYMLLWRMETKQKKVKNKSVKVCMMLGVTFGLALAIIFIFNWQKFMFDILFSTILGTTITAWRLPLKQIEKYEY
ncbi:hypothetical protein [Tenacibaculum caenipelagi]|uniref:Uncharacterized protein n=1 Tax=Tenacibaculum caenipelagi TaxID=1325435 RepID=A0A4V3D2U5_9FLAO|nr:hypothetical protein [Tenacibaculum caenipelagi]TDQ23745.1 hypothetical protein DFQ07_2273 [Tenacibaculum caenipelagi]